MTPNQLLVDLLEGNVNFVKMTLADFTDAEMLVRPAPGANHAAWQLGHLIVAETNLTNAAMRDGTMPELPAGFADKFNKKTASIDDAGAFPKKSELLELFVRQRAATVQWAKALTSQDMAQPAPERIRPVAPTVAHLAAFYPSHVTMHLGQWQVIRRKLGKPVLF
jgi:hypothetical protein